MKSSSKILFFLVAVALLAVAWYLVSPLFRTVEVDEASPLFQAPTQVDEVMIKDDFETMDEERMREFKAEMTEMEDVVMEKEEDMPAGPRVVAQADFKPRAHEVTGRALLIESGEETLLRFEDFETVNGPNLHIYLSSDLGGDDYIDLGEIKATKGNVNYTVDPSIDTGKYNKVLVWCVPFRVLFSYAEL